MVEIRDRESQDIIFRVEAPTLMSANLRGRRIRYAALTGANLQMANLHRADLWGTDFRSADLRLADLTYANLGNADFTGAKLAGVNLDGARYNSRTQWPAGFNPADWGAVLEGPAPTTSPNPEFDADEARRKTEAILAAFRRDRGQPGVWR